MRVGVAVAVDDDVATLDRALLGEESGDLGLVDGAEPRGRERLRARDVAAARLAGEPPAVVGGDRPDVDDREGRVVEPATELVGGDGSPPRRPVRGCSSGVCSFACRANKNPCHLQGFGVRRADRVRPSALRYTRRLPGGRGDTDTSTRSDGSASRREGCPVERPSRNSRICVDQPRPLTSRAPPARRGARSTPRPGRRAGRSPCPAPPGRHAPPPPPGRRRPPVCRTSTARSHAGEARQASSRSIHVTRPARSTTVLRGNASPCCGSSAGSSARRRASSVSRRRAQLLDRGRVEDAGLQGVSRTRGRGRPPQARTRAARPGSRAGRPAARPSAASVAAASGTTPGRWSTNRHAAIPHPSTRNGPGGITSAGAITGAPRDASQVTSATSRSRYGIGSRRIRPVNVATRRITGAGTGRTSRFEPSFHVSSRSPGSPCAARSVRTAPNAAA